MGIKLAGYHGQRLKRINLSLCQSCWCMTKTFYKNGKKYCGKCGSEK